MINNVKFKTIKKLSDTEYNEVIKAINEAYNQGRIDKEQEMLSCINEIWNS